MRGGPAALAAIVIVSTCVKAGPSDLLARLELGSSRVLSEVFDETRSTNHDLVLLRNGDCLAGRLLLSEIRLQTPMGLLRVTADRVAGLDMGREQGLPERLIGVSGDRFTGAPLDEKIPMALAGGGVVTVDRSLIDRVICRVRDGERSGLPRRHWVELVNGDHFTGTIIGEPLQLWTGATGVDVRMSTLDRLSPQGWAPGAEVALLTGGTHAGELSRDTLRIMPDLAVGVPRAEPLEISLLRIARVLSAPPLPVEPPVARPQVAMGIEEIEVGGPPAAGNLNDGPDVFLLRAERGNSYKIQTYNLVGCDTVLTLSRAEDQTVLAENDDGPETGTAASLIVWTCGASGLYALRVRDFSDRHRGLYSLRVEHGQ